MEDIRTAKDVSAGKKLPDRGTGAGEMPTRVAVIGIVVENYDSADSLNEILHQYGQYVIGRMGIPYREKNINIISVAVDAPQNIISAMSGKIGRLPGSARRQHTLQSEGRIAGINWIPHCDRAGGLSVLQSSKIISIIFYKGFTYLFLHHDS